MTLFKIQFTYKGKVINASVHELETPPKQWHITVGEEDSFEGINGTYIIQYDDLRKEYVWGFPNFDFDYSFMHSMGLSLRDYLVTYGWNSNNV